MSQILAPTFSLGRKTESAGTKIDVLVPPKRNRKTKITKVTVQVGATAHTMSFMRPFARTTLSAAALAAQAVINLTADPGDYTGKSTADNAIAANDYLVIEKPDGTFHVGVVSSVATLAITLTANVPTGGFSSGAKVWFLGIFTDTDPNTAVVHPTVTLPASGQTVLSSAHGAVVETVGVYEPILVQVSNATNASTVEGVEGIYSKV